MDAPCVLVLSDSHGRGLFPSFDYYVPDWEVWELSLGRPTQELRELYHETICELLEYAPDLVYLHSGHNDISYHPVHNRSPQQPLACLERILSFLDLLADKHPYSGIYFSTIFPRAVGPGFDAQRKDDYNRMAADLQGVLSTVFDTEGRKYCLNSGLGRDLEAGEEMTNMFNEGGLHLNETGKRSVVRGWVQTAMSSQDIHK
jgi:hypothetical protein